MNITPARFLRSLLGLIVLVAVLAVLGKEVHEPVRAFAGSLVSELGLLGLFAAVVLLDPLPAVGFSFVLFVGHAGGIGFWPLFVFTWLATIVASLWSFALGRGLSGRPWLVSRLENWGLGPWLRRHGARAIATAAVVPSPYGLVTLGAGVTGVPFRTVLLGSSARGLKVLLTLLALQLGWSA